MKQTLLALVAAGLLSLAVPAAALPEVGSQAPDFTLTSLDGETEYTLSELKGQVVYIDFWASWCGPCRRSFPEVMKLHDEYRDQGFVVLAVSLDRKVESAIQFMKKQKATFPSVFDRGGVVARKYGVRNIPSALLVGPDGEVAHSGIGFDPRKLPALKSTIEELLNDVEPELKKKAAEAESKEKTKI